MNCELNRDAKRFLCLFPFFQGLIKALRRFPGSPGPVHIVFGFTSRLPPGFLNIAPDNKKGLLGMAAAPVQLLGCLSGRRRSRTDRQSMASAVQNPMLPLSTQAGRASGVGFLSQPWCRQMLPGCASGRGKGLVLKRGSTLRCLQRGRDTCGKLGDPGQIFQDLKTEMGMLISKMEIKQQQQQTAIT